MDWKLTRWTSVGIVVLALAFGCGTREFMRAPVRAGVLSRIDWKVNGEIVNPGMELTVGAGEVLEISGVLQAPDAWRFSKLGTRSFGKGLLPAPGFPKDLLQTEFAAVSKPATVSAAATRVPLTVLQFDVDGQAPSDLAVATLVSSLVGDGGRKCHLTAAIKSPDAKGTFWLVMRFGSVAEAAYNEYQPTDYGLVTVAEIRVYVK